MKRLIIPGFTTIKERNAFLVANKEQLIAQKKAIYKEGDDIPYNNLLYVGKGSEATKAENLDLTNLTELQVKAVIISAYFLDSHLDVHLPNCWDKSIKENKLIMHVQEHKRWEFKSIISDGADLKVYTEVKSWQELGFNYAGTTEVLMFDSTVRKERNAEMFKQYGKGWVKNHSVGMQYVRLVMCINDKDYGAEKEAWDKYYPLVINKETADEIGFFWAVTECKLIEGSAVPLGSNSATPTISITGKTETPLNSTSQNNKDAATDAPPKPTFYSSILKQNL